MSDELKKAALRDKIESCKRQLLYLEKNLAIHCGSLIELQKEMDRLIQALECNIPF